MDVYETVRTVLAVRGYQDKPIPTEVTRRIVEAGRLTASSMNSQPWHFIVVDDRDKILKIAAEARTGPYIAQAPLVIIVTVEKTHSAVSDGSRAIQSMILTAWAEGIGSNWVGLMDPTEVKRIVGLPNELDILALLPFGYPVKQVGQGKKKRKALSEVADHNQFGQPFK